MSEGFTPWAAVASPADPEMSAVQGSYLVADNLPIEDARMIAAAPDLYRALAAVLSTCGARGQYHALKYCDAVKAADAALRKARGEA